MASGVSMSLSSRKRISRKAIATPNAVPNSRPMRAFVPETLAASQIWSRLPVKASQILDGLGRK